MNSKKLNIIGVIPARFQSTRLPGKPLKMIHGKTMIQWVYENCVKSELLSQVIVATDDEKIYDEVASFGGSVVMTDLNITTGTDRCYFAIIKKNNSNCDYVVNIQGDEPLIDYRVIDETIKSLLISAKDEKLVCSTAITEIKDNDELLSSNTVKVVFDNIQNALYFSRSQIPFIRDKEDNKSLKELTFYKHIGLYVYKREFLDKFVKLPQTNLEKLELLEQLRIIENGYRIKCCKVDYNPIGVDTEEDLEKVREIMKNGM